MHRNSGPAPGGPFRATRLWDEAVRLFTRGMPRKRHMRHMRQYEDCFTGSEAVKWFYQALELNPHFKSLITQEKTVQLLSKFFDEGIFVRVKGSTGHGPERFKLQGIYQMGQVKPQYSARTPLAVKSGLNYNQKEENWIRKSLRKDAFPEYENLPPMKGKDCDSKGQSDYENLPPLKMKGQTPSKPRTGQFRVFKNPQAFVNNPNLPLPVNELQKDRKRFVEHPIQQLKQYHQEQKQAPPPSPTKYDDIWRDVFIERLQTVLRDVDVSGLLWPCAVIRCQWLEHNCCTSRDNGAAKFPPWVKASSSRLLQALGNRDLNRSVVNPDIEADVSALEAYFSSLQAPLIPADLSAIFQRVFLHLEMSATSFSKDSSVKSKSLSSLSRCSELLSCSGDARSMLPVLPPNSCFETAFTSESPVTRIVPQCSSDTLHLPSPMRRNISAPKLLEAFALNSEKTGTFSGKSDRSGNMQFDGDVIHKYSTISGCPRGNKSKSKNDSFDGYFQRKKTWKLSLPPEPHHSSKSSHQCGQLIVTDKTPPIPPRRRNQPPPIRRSGNPSIEEKRTRSHSGGYINLALQDSFEDPEIKNDELDLEAAMETLQKLMLCSQQVQSERSPRKDCQRSLHVRSASLSQAHDSAQARNPELRRSRSSWSQDLSNVSLSSYHTAMCSSASSSQCSTPATSVANSQSGSLVTLELEAGCEWGWDWGSDSEKAGVAVFSLLTLLLPPSSRSQLQHLLKVMGLLPYQCPYTTIKVLEMFSSVIIRNIDGDVADRLLGFMVRHQKEIFSPPHDFLPEVQRLKQEREKLKERAVVSFCERVSLLQFEQQKLTTSQQALAELLDQIVTNQKLSSKERQKKLKMFKESYPHIYSLRFPVSEMVVPKSRHKSILQLGRLRSLRV